MTPPFEELKDQGVGRDREQLDTPVEVERVTGNKRKYLTDRVDFQGVWVEVSLLTFYLHLYGEKKKVT